MSTRDILSAIVVLALAATVFLLSGRYSTGAQMFPRSIAVIMMICAIVLLLRGIFLGESRPGTVEPIAPQGWRRMAIAIVLTLIYVMAVDLVGFVTSSLIFIPTTSHLLGLKDHALVGILTVVFVFGLYFVLTGVFRVPLPPDVIFSWW